MSNEMLLPRGVDDPPHILFWRSDDFAVFGACYCIGLLANQLTIFLILGFAATYWMRKYRDGQPEGFLRHLLWWHGLLPVKARGLLSPFHRQVLPP